ncbi:Uncharacterised protein [Streptococcus pneumoniae]|nr:Uncharacterised protein [Streptococcus pneumoniae]
MKKVNEYVISTAASLGVMIGIVNSKDEMVLRQERTDF